MFIILGTYNNYATQTGNSDFPREYLLQIFAQRWRVFAYNLLVVIHGNRATAANTHKLPKRKHLFISLLMKLNTT